MAKYQTLSEFLYKPFNQKSNVDKDSTYEKKYHEYLSSGKLKIVSVCELEDSFYYHIKVPSESMNQEGFDYDVIIRFFTDSQETISQTHLRNYVLQFFSNSPSFMYKYAYVYKKNGYLIKALYDKLDADYIDTPPTKTNINEVLGYDKSIYFACKLLSEQKFRYLNKTGSVDSKKVDPHKFFSKISDFKSIKVDQAVINEEKRLKKSISGVRENKEKNTTTNKDKQMRSITVVSKKTGKPKIIANKKITGKKKK